MNTEIENLARRAVACKGWRWMPGMRATWPDDSRPGRRYERGWVSDYSGKEKFGCTDEHALPDLTDPATIGCVLALVREAWGDPCMYLAPADGWYVGNGARASMAGRGPTEGAALVAALEAAP